MRCVEKKSVSTQSVPKTKCVNREKVCQSNRRFGLGLRTGLGLGLECSSECGGTMPPKSPAKSPATKAPRTVNDYKIALLKQENAALTQK